MEEQKKEPQDTQKQWQNEEKSDIESLHGSMHEAQEEHQKNHQKEKHDAKDTRIKELISDLKYVQAEFENYKKRCERDNQMRIKMAAKELIAGLLPITDNFELAVLHKDRHEEFVKGVELIYSELAALLEKHGVEPITALNNKFDPAMHEALLQEKTEKEPGIVLEELQKGYMMHGQVIRHTKVKVSK